ncbi:diguanylate cyclase [Nonomuraea sp. NPDC049309]|uniref:sensor domain-containing diguanylate cyclase n=1 Tax=Nonomuraea sp. NPDC049309 TaxID=3364350 RepID=UPI003719BC82
MAVTGHASIKPRDGVSTAADRWPLLGQRRPLVGYLCAIVTLDLLAIILLSASTTFHWWDVLTFAALMACGAVCIEATRRLGMPAGVSRDLLSAWWLPVALLLPPVYAIFAPIVLQVLLQVRVRATVLYRRVFSSAAIGIAGCAASLMFHWFVPDPMVLTRGSPVPLLFAVAAAAVFSLLNTGLIAIAAHTADPDMSWREVLWDRESVLLDVVELCLGILVAIACGLNLALLLFTLPPVVLLQRSLLHAQLQAAARTDAKTGLLNAAAWQREADTEIVRARRTGESLALLIIDIDHFKRVNDAHGHLVGDQVLVGVASTLRSQLRDYDVVGRFGGEEFVVLLPGADIDEARRVAERLRVHISHMAVPVEDTLVKVTVSTGVALMSIHGDDLIDLLAAADLALYRAKELGRDRVCIPAIQQSPPPPRAPSPQTPQTPQSPLPPQAPPLEPLPSQGSSGESVPPEVPPASGSFSAQVPPFGSRSWRAPSGECVSPEVPPVQGSFSAQVSPLESRSWRAPSGECVSPEVPPAEFLSSQGSSGQLAPSQDPSLQPSLPPQALPPQSPHPQSSPSQALPPHTPSPREIPGDDVPQDSDPGPGSGLGLDSGSDPDPMS